MGRNQGLYVALFKDCLAKTKRKSKPRFSNSENLIEAAFDNTSMVADDDRSMSKMYDAVMTINKFLCPGIWCTRTHCQEYSSISAYHCNANNRPTTCKLFFDYKEKQLIKNKKLIKGDEAKAKLIEILTKVYNTPEYNKREKSLPDEDCITGYYYDNDRERYIAFNTLCGVIGMVDEYKRDFEAVMALHMEKNYVRNQEIMKELLNI